MLFIYSAQDNGKTWDLVYSTHLEEESVTAMAWSRTTNPTLIVAQDRLWLYSVQPIHLSWQSELLSDHVSYLEFNDSGDMFAAISNVGFNLFKKRL
jgi:hypothetical protein